MRKSDSEEGMKVKFVADGMLGKLTRWLRMLGYDVKYSNNLDDAQLIAIAKKEGKILLTRDMELYQQATAKSCEAFYTEGKNEAERLAQLAKRFNIELNIDMTKSRCPKCNVQVEPTAKEKVAEKVGKNTFTNYEEFWKCPECEQIYWQGTHWIKIRKTLDAAKDNLKKLQKQKRQVP